MKDTLRYLTIVGLVYAQIGCSPGSQGTPPPDGGNPDGASIDAPLDPNAPNFLVFGTDITTLTDEDTVRFSAVLSDPDGIDDVIGGVLISQDGTISYGAFATSGQEGAYSLELSWWDFHRHEDLTFPLQDPQSPAQQERVFVAEFFDVAGHVSRASIALNFVCEFGDFGVRPEACYGSCVDTVRDPEHCGTCGRQCPEDTYCTDGECVRVFLDERERMTCRQFCEFVGFDCVAGCGVSHWGIGFYPTPGDHAYSWKYGGADWVYGGSCDTTPPAQNSEGSDWDSSFCCCAAR